MRIVSLCLTPADLVCTPFLYNSEENVAFFAYFFFLHSTSNLTYCLRKRTLGVRASWLGSHEHSVAHEMWVVGLIKTTINYLFTYSSFFETGFN